MLRFISALFAFSLISLCGCSTLPAHVAEPTRGEDGAIVKIEGGNGPIPVAMNIDVLDTQLRAYAITWDNAETELRYELTGADSFEFAALVWSAYKIATGRMHDAKWGAAAAGGVGLFESKYQIQVQAVNYRNANVAIRCLYKNIHSLPSAFWNGVFDPKTGEIAFSKSVLDSAIADLNVDGVDPKIGYSTLQDLWTTINSDIGEIDNRLRDQQRDLRIGIPSSQELTQAFNGGAKAQEGADRAAPALARAAAQKIPVSEQTIADGILLPKKLDACVAAMGK